MKKKKLLSVMMAMTLAITATACTNTGDAESSASESMIASESVIESSDIVEVIPQDIELAELDVLADAGIITGVKDLKVSEGTDVDLNELVFVDDAIVTDVKIDDSTVDYGKTGSYEAIYTITFDGEALRGYLDENKLAVTFDTDGDTVIVNVAVAIEIINESEAEEAIESGSADVVTEDTKEDIQSSNQADAVDTAKQSSGNKNSGSDNNSSGSSGNKNNSDSSGNSNKGSSGGNSSGGSSESSSGNKNGSSGNNNSGSNSGSSDSGSSGGSSSGNKNGSSGSNKSGNSSSGSSGSSSGNSGNSGNISSNGSSNSGSGSSGGTATAHTHSYTSKVTKAATCGSAGVRTYICSCGDSYTESIPATGSHSWVAQTTTVHHDEVGHYETVTVQEAYDETIYESRPVCNACGTVFTSVEEAAYHGIITEHGNYSIKKVAVDTKHHDAVTEQKWVVDQKAYDETVTTGYKCSVCGATK